QNERIYVAASSSFPVYDASVLGTHGGSTMSAVAEVRSTVAHSADPRGSALPTCPVCADSMVAAEASAYLTDRVISYLWTCDTCGYGFVTKHALKRFACN